MELSIAKDIEELSLSAAEWIAFRIQSVLKSRDQFTIVLSGGSTPKKIYQLLAKEKFEIEWKKIHFFWGDERMVPITDERNNAGMAFTNLLDHVPVIKENIHVMRTDIEPEVSAIEYEQLLRNYFPNGHPGFDLVLLGLGEDAHTLSLFPGDDTVFESTKWVKSVYLEDQKMYRLTLTPPVVNSAECVLFLVSGKEKAKAVHHLLEDSYDLRRFPAQSIRPFNGELYWFVDEAAAAFLE